MIKDIRFEDKNRNKFINKNEMEMMENPTLAAKRELLEGIGAGNDYLGWIDLPLNYDKKEFEKIQKTAKKIQEDSEVLLVIGIGGSYLGARAAINFLGNHFQNRIVKDGKKTPEIYFAGQNLSSGYIQDLIDGIGDKDFSINVISKSGTTIEPALAFRIFKRRMYEKYGQEEGAKRIYVTTDESEGALIELAEQEKYDSFVIPRDIGGRYSVLTAVGLLPIAVAGGDIEEIMKGAEKMRENCINDDYENNDALRYAASRNILQRKGKTIEILTNYDPSLKCFSEWWRQLFGESEGKDHKGLYPAVVNFTTDLHSIGQYIQDGTRNIFETVLNIEKDRAEFLIGCEVEDVDGLNYLCDNYVSFVNENARKGALLAHVDGGVPNFTLSIPEQTEFYLGQLFYFFEFACAVSGYILGVNPFDQPGVESYKKNMFALLGRPGYEERREELERRLL